MNRVALHTLGCKLNLAESATIARQFTSRGFNVVHLDDPADVVVLNTCSVTERADRECRQLVRRALRHSPNAYVIVLGCYAQLQPETLGSIPGVDLVLGTKEKFDVFRHADWKKSGTARLQVTPIDQVETFTHAHSSGFAERTRAFLKIQDGCDFTCSFCTIPLARGASRSVGTSAILEEAREIVRQGYREIVLTGVNVGDYGKTTGTSLLELVRRLERLAGLERLRISSVEPNLLTDELLDFWLTAKILCHHFHIPLQSGSDQILRGMRRRYVRKHYIGRIERIKSLSPKAGIGADVIVGFPGETDQLFEETYRFLVDLPLSYLHVFSYSERPRTPSIGFPDSVRPEVRAERSERLRILSAKKRRSFQESFVGSTVPVLFESRSEDGYQIGLTPEYVRVKVRTQETLENMIRSVRIDSVEGDSCLGMITGMEVPAPSERMAVSC